MLSKFLIKKIAFILLFFFLFSTLLSKPIRAFSTETIGGGYLFNFEGAVFKTEEMNLQSFVNETFKATAFSIITAFAGCLSCSPEDREKYPGFIFSMGNFIAGVYASPPASGTRYLADLGSRLGITKPVYAQEGTIGFDAMRRILPVWRAFRNISYVFFVLTLVLMGFAIMFRVKISPQAVITIQSALPKIVLALVLITFSYAIVGFMIDLMYVLLFLINGIFRQILLAEHLGALGDAIQTIFNWLESEFNAVEVFGVGVPLLIQTIFINMVFFGIVPLMALILLFIMGPFGWLFALLVIILIVIALLRCLWTLLRAYAMIIINLIFAPLIILVGVLPGSGAIGSWFRNVLANIAVLPAMVTMFFLASYLILVGVGAIFQEPLLVLLFVIGLIPGIGQVIQAAFAGITFPIALGSILLPTLPFWQYFSMVLLPFVGLAILLMAPRVSDMIQSFIRGRPFEYGAAIGEVVGYPGRMVGYGVRGTAALTGIGQAWTTRFGFRRAAGGAEPGRPAGEAPPVPETG